MIDKLSKRWSVVVLGRWNRAILTPVWIGKTLLGVSEGEELEIQVPMDTVGPFRVSHGGLTVIVSDTLLVVEVANADFNDLERAAKAATKTMTELPRTPVVASGVNIFQSCNDEEVACISRMWTSE